MTETFEQLEQLRRSESRVAMATLVATRGTTPKKEGAKMWVGGGGRIVGSVTIGGCVDVRVIEEAENVLATAEPRLLSITLGDEDAWELGMTCGGEVDVLMERLDLERDDEPILRAYDIVRQEVEAHGRHAVIVRSLDGRRSPLVVLSDGSMSGTSGTETLDRAVRDEALAVIRTGQSRTITVTDGEGSRDMFFELHGPPTTLVVFGAGNVAVPLVRLARELGLRTVVVDGRPRFASRERFPGADEIIVGIPSEVAASLRCTPSTFVVLVAHDYKYDVPVLRAVLGSNAGYIGMLGSKRRGRAILDLLAGDGVSPETLARVHVPVGLDIGAQTAAEIALSILAEAIAVRTGRPGARRQP